MLFLILRLDYAWKIIKEMAIAVLYKEQELTEKREVSKYNTYYIQGCPTKI